MPGKRTAGVLAGIVATAIASLGGIAAPASAAETPVPVAVVVPLVVPLDAPALLTADDLGEWTAPGGLLDERLSAVEGSDATLGVDPRITASIRLLGDDAPASAAAWLDRLESLPNETFALGWADADVDGLTAIGRADLAAPQTLQFAVQPERFDTPPAPEEAPATDARSPDATTGAPTATPTADPTPTASDDPAEPAEPALPSDEELLAVPRAIAAVWGSTNVLVTEAGPHPVDSPVIFDVPVPGTVLAFSRDVTDTSAPVGGMVSTLEADPRIDIVPLSALPASGSAPALSDARAELLERMVTTLDAESRVASVTDDPAAFRARRGLELLRALALGGITRSPELEEAFIDRSIETRGAVSIAESSDLLVLSNTTGLPVTIVNGLDVPVTVFVDARPLRPSLRIDDVPREVTVEAGASQTVYLSAQAVTNGHVDVLSVLRNRDGARVGAERTLRVDLQAQWETIGIVIIALLGAVLAAGVVRNILKRRREARAGETDLPETVSDESAGTPAASADSAAGSTDYAAETAHADAADGDGNAQKDGDG